MTSNPLVSIGMPTWNRAHCIRESLDSLLGQTYQNIELIISDNASPDGTEEICRQYAKEDERVRYIRQKENIGVINNYNYVLRESRGDYFMWACDDDLWEKEFIRKLLQGFEGRLVMGVFCKDII